MRALLCAKFVADQSLVPPVNFHVLIDKYISSGIKNQLKHVLVIKAQGGEKDAFEIPKELWVFTDSLYQALSSHVVADDKCRALDRFDEILRRIVV